MWHGLKQGCIIIIIIIIMLGCHGGDGGCGRDHDSFCTSQNCALCKIEHVVACKKFRDK